MDDQTPRVLMVVFRFPPILGGAEVQTSRLAAALVRRNVRVKVVTARFPSLAAFEKVDGVPIYRVSCPSDEKAITRRGLYTFMFSLAWFLLAHAREYDLIHCHQAMFASAVAVAVGRRLGKKTIVKFGGAGVNSDFENLRRLRFGAAMIQAIKQADSIIATSKTIQHDLESYGIRSQQIVSIPNGIDTQSFAPAGRREGARAALGITNDASVVLFVGNLRALKGVDVLLNAWPRVVARCPAARLVIVGDGALRGELENQAARLELSTSVRFAGAKSDPREFYWAADIFVLPSRTEGFPNVILEALAAGLPCVASAVGGINDQIEAGRNGLLVPPEDPNGLTEAIVQLLGDDARRYAMSVHAAETARRYDWDRIAPQCIALYRRLAEQTV